MDDEPRLRTEDSDLGEALRDAQNVGPDDTERAAMLAGLGFVLGPPPSGGVPSGPEAATSGAAGGVAALKWVAAACLVGGAAWWGLQDVPSSERSDAPAAFAQAPERPDEPLALPAEAAVPMEEEHLAFAAPEEDSVRPIPTNSVATREESVAPRRVRRPAPSEALVAEPSPVEASPAEATEASSSTSSATARSAEASDVPTAAPPAPTELGLLAEARRVLRSTPSQTLRLTNEHRERFDRGALVEEREVLAIEALVRLEREPQASARAERFRRRFPGSIHASRLSAILSR